MKLYGRNLRQKLLEHLPREHEPFYRRFIMWSIVITLTTILGGLFIFTITVAVLSIGLPDVRQLDKLAGVESTLILDREGGILYAIHGEENRKYVELNEISPFLRKATIAIEDDEFFEHSGFDIPGITAGALYEAFGIGRRRGGSTITQQLAKNAFLSAQRSYIRKIKELILAIRLERAYDKNKILELYLNRIPYGNNAYGAELASQMYFGKSARELTLAESAVLAALPNAPTLYSPYGPNLYSKLDTAITAASRKKNLPKSIQDLEAEDYTTGLIGRTIVFSPTESLFIPGRADIILKRMHGLGGITDLQRKQATEELQLLEFRKHRETIRAAHFVFEVRRQLEEQFGKDVVAQGGLRVYTTLDPNLQRSAEETVSAQIIASKETHGVSTGALFALDAKTGEILAMVGSADYFDEEAHGNVNHVFSKLQPGSTFKPFIYAKAFLNRYSPATVLYDAPTDFGGNYKPQNYEGGFRGPMSIRQALGQSRNLPAIKAYFLAGQQQEIVQFVNKLGITSLDPQGDYGPPLAIGAGETTLAQMVQGFSVFANNGLKRPAFAIKKVLDRDDDVLFEYKEAEVIPEQVLDPQVAYLITHILSDKSVWLGPRLNVPGHTTAAKTGTSNKEISVTKILPSNVWTIGYTPSIIAGVWAGNSDGSPMKGSADGYNIAAPIWAKFMSTALEGKPNEEFPVPEGIKTVTVSKASGKLPSEQTPADARTTELFTSFSVPTEYDDVYQQLEVNKLDGLLPNEFTPKEQIEKRVFMNHHDPINTYFGWLPGVKEWVAKKRTENSAYPDFPPTETTKMFNAQSAQNAPSVQIVSPAAYSVIPQRTMPVELAIDAPHGVDKVSFYLDDRPGARNTQRKAPFNKPFNFPKSTKPGPHIITVKVFDKRGYVGEARVEIRYEGPTDADANANTTADDGDEIP